MNYYEFSKILEQQNIQKSIQDLKSDKGSLGTSAWSALQQIYSSLKVLAQENPQKLMSIVQKIQSEIKSSHPELAKGLTSGTNQLIGKSKNN